MTDTRQKYVKLKNYKFINERKEVTKKLLKILKINQNNKTFNNLDLDTNEQIQNNILSLIPEIELYFSTSQWTYHHKDTKKNKPYISIAKSVLKDMGICLFSSSKAIKYNNKFVTCTYYLLDSTIDEYI